MPGRFAGLLRRVDLAVLRFAAVGVASTLLYAGLALAATALLPGPAAVAALAAYALAAVFSYTAHRRFTFRSDRPHAEAAPRFVGLSLVGWGIAAAAPALETDWAGLPPVMPIATTVVLVPLVNFVLMRRMVFADGRPAEATP